MPAHDSFVWPSGQVLHPFVELLVLRATGETSNTTTHAGSLAAQKDWVALRLLQQQQSLVRTSGCFGYC